jgi:phosphotransferase system enzyme I (PtsI)
LAKTNDRDRAVTFSLHGQAVSGGIAIGRAHLVSNAILEVAHYQLRERDITVELARFDKAVATAGAELDVLRSEASVPGAPAELSAFVDVHAMILADPTLSEGVRELIRERRCNAEWALVQQMQLVVDQFDEFEDAYLRERKQDIVQVVERVLKVLQGKARKITRRKANADDDLIVVANDLSPADTIQFKNLRIGGFVTDLGGSTSHTAIVARSLAIPAVVGMQHARPLIQDDDLLIVDGTRGALIVDPDLGVLQEYRLRKAELELERSKLRRLIGARAQSLDGEDVELHANIELPQDTDRAREVGADGIGLFRTEFLFMNRDDLLPARTSSSRPIAPWSRPWAASRSPFAPWTSVPTRKRVPCASAPATAFRPIRRWACARSASAWPSRSCSWCSCAPSCAPRTTARCAC